MEAKWKRLTLDLEPTMQRRLKMIAALKGISMRQYCIVAIEKELARDEAGKSRVLPIGEESVNPLAASAAEVPGGRQAPDDSVDEDTEAKVQGQ